MRWQPALRIAAPWYDDPVYIDALARSMRAGLARLDFEPEIVLASFHGIPQAYFDKGDPYYCHCAKTTRLLREALGWDEHRLRMTFQSRFGRAEWLKPYTADTVRDAGERRRQAPRRRHAGLRRRLPRDAGGDRRRERRLFQGRRRRTLRRHPLPQRQRRRHGGDRGRRAARAHGLGGVDARQGPLREKIRSSQRLFRGRRIVVPPAAEGGPTRVRPLRVPGWGLLLSSFFSASQWSISSNQPRNVTPEHPVKLKRLYPQFE